MSQKLAGKVAVVTGASKGIGASIALYLAAEGASVAVNFASSKEGAERVASDIRQQGGKAITVGANIAKGDDIERLFAETKKAFGHVDILVNNAGIYEFASIEEVTPEHFHKQFDLNVLGLLLASREAVKNSGPRGAVSSISARWSLRPLRQTPRSIVRPRPPSMRSQNRLPRNWARARSA